MPTVTYIDARLAANTSKFDSGLHRGQRSLQRFSREADRTNTRLAALHSGMSRSLGRLAALAAAYFGVRAAIRALGDAAERMDKRAKTADTLGLTSGEMQAFTRTAELAGVEVESVTKALGFMTRAIGKTQVGTEAMRESAARSFEQIGLDVDKLQRMTPVEQFGAIADAINSLPTQTEKAAAAAKIFGNSWLELMPFIAAGADGLRESEEFLQRMGIAANRIDDAKVEEMLDTWSDVSLVLKGITEKWLAQFAPLLTEIGRSFLKLVETSHGFGSAIQGAFVGANEVIKATGTMIAWVGEVTAKATAEVLALKAELMESLTGERSFITQVAAELVGLGDDFQMAAKQAREMQKNAESVGKVWEDKRKNWASEWDARIKAAEDRAKALAEAGKSRRGGWDEEDAFGGAGGTNQPGPPRIAQRGSAEAASIINQMNRQNQMADRIAGAMRDVMMEWSEKDMAMVEVTHTLIGDTNKHLEKIADAATEEPGDEL